MALAIAFVELTGAAILLIMAITGAPVGDVLSGQALADYQREKQAAASGSSSSSSTTTSTPGSTVTGGRGPFAPGTSVMWERTDQGRDASAPPGTPIQAIETGVVTDIIDFYKGQPAVIVSSPGLPGGAEGIYYAEQLTPSVHIGQHVNAGDPIGVVAQSGTGLEFGFWKGSSTLAQATTGYTEGQVTHAGQLFDNFLTSLGVKL